VFFTTASWARLAMVDHFARDNPSHDEGVALSAVV
jgi:hypothetical protein